MLKAVTFPAYRYYIEPMFSLVSQVVVICLGLSVTALYAYVIANWWHFPASNGVFNGNLCLPLFWVPSPPLFCAFQSCLASFFSLSPAENVLFAVSVLE